MARFARGRTAAVLAAGLLAGEGAALDCPTGRPTPQGVTRTGSTYRAAPTDGEARLASGQAADLVLSAVGFDDAGGPLLFNHPGGIASDGRRLLLCDRNNNRVLVWTTLPSGNTPPDLVLGQKALSTIAPGTARDQMNWPIAVHTDGTRVLVADAYNDRILIWTSFPTRSGQPADLVLRSDAGGPGNATKATFRWPWGVWTDGVRVVVTATGSGSVNIWSSFPTRDDQPADLRLTGGGSLGTPRGVVSDGRSLIVGDHNARIGTGQTGNWVWRAFPTSDDAVPDYFIQDPCTPNAGQMNGEILPDGRLLLLGRGLYVWNQVPASASTPPDLSIAYDFFAGDGSDVTAAGSRLYLSTGNANKIVGYSSFPSASQQLPDLVIGSPDLATNTLDTAFIMSNPVPASNGTSLFVTSDFDRRLYVYRSLPDESGAHPDLVYQMADGAWDNALFGDTFVTAGNRTLQVWKTLPLDGKAADVTFNGQVGTVTFKRFSGVALDARYLYASDPDSQKIHVFRGIPSATDAPAFSLDLPDAARLDSDGTWLVVTRTTTNSASVAVYRVADLAAGATPASIPFTRARPNLPQYATVREGRLFVADTNNNRVLSWTRMEDALAGRDPDLVLGAPDISSAPPARIGASTFFWPGAPFFDGRYLWVGEFKFSERLLRFGGFGAPVEPSFPSVSFIPGAASAAGAAGSRWMTDLSLFNPDAGASRTVRLSFLRAGADNRSAAEVSLEVPPSRSVTLSDVVSTTLGASGGGGLRLRATGDVLATTRTYDAAAATGRFSGVLLTALPASAAAASGTLFPLSSQAGPTGTRSNVGFLNPSEEAARVELELLDATSGALLGRTSVDLPPLGFAQLSDVFSASGEVPVAAARFVATRPVFVYGVVLENATSQGRLVLPR